MTITTCPNNISQALGFGKVDLNSQLIYQVTDQLGIANQTSFINYSHKCTKLNVRLLLRQCLFNQLQIVSFRKNSFHLWKNANAKNHSNAYAGQSIEILREMDTVGFQKASDSST